MKNLVSPAVMGFRIVLSLLLSFAFLATSIPGRADVPSGCRIWIVWGHYQETMLTLEQMRINQPNSCVAPLACSIGEAGNLPGRRPQPGSNGPWMRSVKRDQNGGLNPDLGPGLERLLDGREDYLEQILGVGFFRLLEHTHLAALRMAERRLRSGACPEVILEFRCSSTSDEMDTLEIDRRIRLATETNLEDSRSRTPLATQLKMCGKNVSGQEIWNVPRSCNEQLRLLPPDSEVLRKGECFDQIQTIEKSLGNYDRSKSWCDDPILRKMDWDQWASWDSWNADSWTRKSLE